MSDAATPWFVDFSDVWLAYNEELLQKNQFAVEAIDLKVRKGEFIAIVGPSGCGKSTFMKLTTGLKMPSKGRIRDRRSTCDRAAEDFGNGFPGVFAAAVAHDRGQRACLPLEIVEPYRSNFRQRRKEYEERARKLLQKGRLGRL
jgi:NitT/TauT family transport system ATP-binding protein